MGGGKDCTCRLGREYKVDLVDGFNLRSTEQYTSIFVHCLECAFANMHDVCFVRTQPRNFCI